MPRLRFIFSVYSHSLALFLFQPSASQAESAFKTEEDWDSWQEQQFDNQEPVLSDRAFDGASFLRQPSEQAELVSPLNAVDEDEVFKSSSLLLPAELAKVPDIPLTLSASRSQTLRRQELLFKVGLKLPLDIFWQTRSRFFPKAAKSALLLAAKTRSSRLVAPSLAAQSSEAAKAKAPFPATALSTRRKKSRNLKGRELAAPEKISQSERTQELRELYQELITKAEVNSGLIAAQKRVVGAVHRARLSGTTPEMRLRGVHGLDSTRSLEQSGGYYGDSTQRDGYDALLEVRLTFRLGRLLFAEQEPTLLRLQLQVLSQREKLRKQVADALSKWVKACSRLALERQGQLDLHPDEVYALRDALFESELSLELLSGGWFATQSHRYKTLLRPSEQALPSGNRTQEGVSRRIH